MNVCAQLLVAHFHVCLLLREKKKETKSRDYQIDFVLLRIILVNWFTQLMKFAKCGGRIS